MTSRREGALVRRLLAFVTAEVLIAGALAVAALVAAGAPAARETQTTNRHLAAELRLTDLALWSGPSYCRHPTQADRFAPFGDHPSALEHFPAGSLVPPTAPGGTAAGRAVPRGAHSQP